MTYERITVRREGPCAIITLNRPEVHNALDTLMLEEIQAALRSIEADPGVIVVVVTGAGERAFCAGIDVEEVKNMNGLAARAMGRRLHATFEAVRRIDKPVIGRIRGLCLGAGLELAVSCDLLVASDDARFGFPHMRIGIPCIVEAGIVPQAVGIFRTKELCFTADFWDAHKAEQCGLINRAVPTSELDQAVDELVTKLAGYSPLAMAMQKDIIHKWMTADLETAVDFSINTVAINFESYDQKEGMAAFLERRPPRFQGR